MRQISFALTTPQILAGSKDVTRRNGWQNATAGQSLQGIEKGQGIKKGEHVKKLRKILLQNVRRERLDLMITNPAYGAEEVIREGFPEKTPAEFVQMYCQANKCTPAKVITRLE